MFKCRFKHRLWKFLDFSRKEESSCDSRNISLSKTTGSDDPDPVSGARTNTETELAEAFKPFVEYDYLSSLLNQNPENTEAKLRCYRTPWNLHIGDFVTGENVDKAECRNRGTSRIPVAFRGSQEPINNRTIIGPIQNNNNLSICTAAPSELGTLAEIDRQGSRIQSKSQNDREASQRCDSESHDWSGRKFRERRTTTRGDQQQSQIVRSVGRTSVTVLPLSPALETPRGPNTENVEAREDTAQLSATLAEMGKEAPFDAIVRN